MAHFSCFGDIPESRDCQWATVREAQGRCAGMSARSTSMTSEQPRREKIFASQDLSLGPHHLLRPGNASHTAHCNHPGIQTFLLQENSACRKKHQQSSAQLCLYPRKRAEKLMHAMSLVGYIPTFSHVAIRGLSQRLPGEVVPTVLEGPALAVQSERHVTRYNGAEMAMARKTGIPKWVALGSGNMHQNPCNPSQLIFQPHPNGLLLASKQTKN